MNRPFRPRAAIACAVLLPALSCAIEPLDEQPVVEGVTGAVTRSFQDGVAPASTWHGTRDTYLSQSAPTTAMGASSTDRIDGDDPTGTGRDLTTLIRWDLSTIPAGSVVRSVRLTVHVTNASAGSYSLFAIKRGWTESQATWQLAATGVAWSVPGAEGGGDRGASSLGTLSLGTTGDHTVALGAAAIAQVQAWVDDPASNHGLAVASSTTSDGLAWSSREATTASERPRLTVSYDPPTASDAGTTSDAGSTDAATDAASDAGAMDASSDGGAVFPAGTICNATGVARPRPARLRHVIVVLMENKGAGAVLGSSQAPYFNALARQCGYSTQFLDNVFPTDLPSEPHYLALTSGSNCNSGLGTSGSGCITDDNGPASHTLATSSIFAQVGSWRAYQESMPSACDPSGAGEYAPKHNPPVFYSALGGCSANDVPIAAVSCPTTVDTVCSTPANALTQDLANDSLPAYAFVTPNLINDMHDGTVSQGDNWLHTYLPRVFASPAYLRGEVALYVLWDESSTNGAPQPDLFVSPYVQPTVSSATVNLFAALRAAEDQLGLATHLGCASGAAPGTGAACPAGSTADLRSIFNF